jgi:hypothetical protein
MTGPATITPTRLATAPMPATVIMASPPTTAAATTAATPPPRTTVPATLRPREAPLVSSAASRRAAIGLVRDARTAGPIAATRVATRPTTRATTSVPAEITMPPAGSAPPATEKMALSSPAMPSPAAKPRIEPTSPTASASTTTATSTCLRAAPTARSSAISRVRCATRIENVL